MISSDYIFKFPYTFDINKLNTILSNKKNQKNLFHFQYPFDIDQYTFEIKKKFEFLSPIFNVYKSIPNLKGPIHIDAHRNAALNIPLYGTQKSYTIFYRSLKELDLEYNSKQFLYHVRSDVNECFRFTLDQPTVINTSYPHSVINGPTIRAILSWSIIPEYSFDQIKQILKSK